MPRFPVPKVSSTAKPTVVSSGETCKVYVQIDGDSVHSSKPIPASVVLVLDFSGSMDSSVGELRNAAKAVLGLLGPTDLAAIVAFNDTVASSGALTNNFKSLEVFVDGRDADGGTLFEPALKVAISLLRGASSSRKFIVLFSDGAPSDHDKIYDVVKGVTADDISISTVGIGGASDSLLKLIADTTGGIFNRAKNVSDLAGTFKAVTDEGRHTLSLMHVEIEEVVSPDFNVVPDSLTISTIPSSNDRKEFESALAIVRENFEKTRKLSLPAVRFLPASKQFTYSYEVYATNCRSADRKEELRIPKYSHVRYRDGSGNEKSESFPSTELTIRKCGVHFDKEWVERDKQLKITVINSYDQPVWEVVVNDWIAPDFEIDRATVVPTFNSLDTIASSSGYFGQIIGWDLGEVSGLNLTEPDKSRRKIRFCLLDRPPFLRGSKCIEVKDRHCYFNMAERAFEIDDRSAEFSMLENDLTTAALSSGVIATFKACYPSMTATAAVVRPSPRKEFSHAIEFGNAVEHTTGRFFVRLAAEGRKFEIYGEVKHIQDLPQLYTSTYYEPGP